MQKICRQVKYLTYFDTSCFVRPFSMSATFPLGSGSFQRIGLDVGQGEAADLLHDAVGKFRAAVDKAKPVEEVGINGTMKAYVGQRVPERTSGALTRPSASVRTAMVLATMVR